jgi:hypothetical protein
MKNKNKQHPWLFPSVFLALTLGIFLSFHFKTIFHVMLSCGISIAVTAFIYLFWAAFLKHGN